jgi:hypothetical protein
MARARLLRMPHKAAPTADAAVFGYLLFVLMFMATTIAVVYWLTRPTVLPNSGLAAFEQEKRAVVLLTAPSLELERAAVELATQENKRQGLQPVSIAARSDQQPPRHQEAAVVSQLPKAKQAAAKVQRRHTVPNARGVWASTSPGAPVQFGIFGPWVR